MDTATLSQRHYQPSYYSEKARFASFPRSLCVSKGEGGNPYTRESGYSFIGSLLTGGFGCVSGLLVGSFATNRILYRSGFQPPPSLCEGYAGMTQFVESECLEPLA